MEPLGGAFFQQLQDEQEADSWFSFSTLRCYCCDRVFVLVVKHPYGRYVHQPFNNSLIEHFWCFEMSINWLILDQFHAWFTMNYVFRLQRKRRRRKRKNLPLRKTDHFLSKTVRLFYCLLFCQILQSCFPVRYNLCVFGMKVSMFKVWHLNRTVKAKSSIHNGFVLSLGSLYRILLHILGQLGCKAICSWLEAFGTAICIIGQAGGVCWTAAPTVSTRYIASPSRSVAERVRSLGMLSVRSVNEPLPAFLLCISRLSQPGVGLMS